MPVSTIDELPRPLAIVCHDAGAANIILHSFPRDAQEVRLFAAGPAANIAKNMELPSCNSLGEALNGAQCVLTGTGWSSDLEHEARAIAKDRGITSIAVLDHWVNYPQRFERDGKTITPDRIWVTDEYAVLEASRHFRTDTIDIVPNEYRNRQLAAVTPISSRTQNILLYVLEPARSTWTGDAEGEFQALDYFADRVPNLGLPGDLVIRLRPHPSDPQGKYDSWMSSRPALNLELDHFPDMASALSETRWVAGCESFALTLALDAGRTVFCTLPPSAPQCRLPHTGIVHLKSLEFSV